MLCISAEEGLPLFWGLCSVGLGLWIKGGRNHMRKSCAMNEMKEGAQLKKSKKEVSKAGIST